MTTPEIQFIPQKNAVSANSKIILDLLVKIIPPQPEIRIKRPTLNLGLVIDRSGSMQGEKIEYARQAACYAVEQLLPTDRVSVVSYDDQIETIVPNTLATNKNQIINQIQQIYPRNATALHAGWLEGGIQVSQQYNPQQLNRVILLSDGLANTGETNPNKIAADVAGLAQRGVSTTTMGVGDDYNEDLLELMANSGDGSYYYIDSPDQLPEIFSKEMQGILATFGRNVRLRIEPQGDVELLDVFNDFEISRQGEYQLPNLISGNAFLVALRLQIPPASVRENICYFRLTWDDSNSQNQKLRVGLELPIVTDSELAEIIPNPEVQQQVTLMQAARVKKQAVERVDRGEYELASKLLQDVQKEVLAAPSSPLMEQEAQALIDLDNDLKARRVREFRKSSHYQSHTTTIGVHQSDYLEYQVARRQRYQKKHSGDVKNRIEVIQGDITQQQVDAIVNASNASLSGEFGVDAAIQNAGGKELKAVITQLNGCKIGEAKITPGYQLSAKWVIHTVGPNWLGGNSGEAQQLAQCYQNCLNLAEQYAIRTIAFPAISTGMKGFPSDIAAQIAVEEVVKFLLQNNSIQKVIFVCFELKDYQCVLSAIGS